MDDSGIIALYWAREERALEESSKKYGAYCWNISYRIVKNRQDAEECVNDTWIKAWNAIPPHRPFSLGAFLGKITRNLSINVYRSCNCEKRNQKTVTIIDELTQCCSCNPETLLDAAELGHLLDQFLRKLPQKDCCIFLRRYWYLDSLHEIAARYHLPLGSIKSSLYRSRKKLRLYLEQEGISV